MYYIPASPTEAKELGLTYYFTGVPCKRGHSVERYALGASCVMCKSEQALALKISGKRNVYSKRFSAKTQKITREIIASLTKLELKEIREEMRLFNKRVSYKDAIKNGQPYYCSGEKCKNGHVDLRNVDDRRCLSCQKEKAIGRPTKTWSERSESSRQKHNAATSRWVARNKTAYRKKQNTFNAARKAYQRQATPSWLSAEHKKQTAFFYSERDRLTKETGIRMQVDHIIPLRGKNVSGLHVPWNLQVLPAKDNNRKSNKHG